MLLAFFDDSGIEHKNPRISVVGGYLALADRAEALQEDWKRIFKRAGLRSFHMAEFESSQGEYLGWQDSEEAKFKRQQHIASLTYHLNLRSLVYVGTGTLTDVFESVVESRLTPENKVRLGGPHAFCFQACIIEISNWIAANRPNEIVDVYFEGGTKLGSELLKMYGLCGTVERLSDKFKINQIKPLSKGESIGILPADLVAYETFKYHLNKRVHPDIPLRKSAEAVMAGKKTLGKFFHDPMGINQFLDMLEHAGVLKGRTGFAPRGSLG